MKRTSIIRVLAGALFCLALAHSKGAGAACTAVPKTVVKARLSISADDRADIYINGRFFARTPSLYSYTSVYNYPVPLGWLNPGMGNVIAVTNYDLHSGDMGTAYKLLITYSDGSFDEIISDPAQFPILYYYDGYNTPGPLSFPPNVAGLPWYAVNYSPGAGWNPALAYTPACFGGWASIPYSGGTVPWMGSVPCNTVNSYQTWSFRQFFPICSFPTPTLTPTPSPSRTPPPCVYTVNLNAGGPSFFDSGGGFWYADQAYSPGGFGYVGAPGAYSTVNTISNTLDPVLYQTNNQNTGLQYKFDVPNGSYQVTLKFSENYFTQPGQRVFSATANGTPVVSGLDLVDVAGPNTAYDVTFLLTVSGGLIDIAFQTGIDAPMVNAIQVMGVLPQCTQTNTPTISPTFTVSRTFSSSPSSTISATHTPSPTRSATFTISPTFSRSPSFTLSPTISATATPTPFVTATATPTSFAIPPCAYVKRINGGGPAYTDSAGNPWAADQPYAAGGFGYVGAGSFCSGSPIAGTADPVLYQCEHESASLEYKFSVPNGNYLVTMKFAELWFTAVNQRVFTVFAQGVAVIPNLDIVAQAGPLAAYDQTFMVTVSTGILDLTALAAVNTPLVSAIQVIGMASLCTPTPTSTPSPSPSPTPSETLSFTRTPSPTPSFSPSSTATWTPSSSPSASPTATPTLTWSPTATPSPTPSVTRTQTPSVTVTFLDTYTSSPTVTPTPSVTLTASPSPSITPTGTGSATPTPSPTATMTASPTLSGTPTLTLSPQDTPSSSPTATPSGTPTMTPTISPTPTMTPSSTPTFSATLSFTRSPSPTASWTHTKSVTPSPLFSAEMQVFNSAGELVATLARGLRSYASPTGLRALGGAFIPDDGSAADFMLEGPNTVLSWDGANSQGQLVSAGIYRVLVVIKDPFGRVTSFSAPASVVRQPQSVELGIYNSAGELVRHFSRAAGSPDAGSMLLIPERVLLLGGPGGSPPAKLAIRYGTQAGDQFLWDGMNAAGIPVQAGTYTVRMAKPQSGGTVVMTGSVTVLASAAPDQGPLMAVPNPLRPGQALRILYPPCGACRVQARLYNMAGEAVASGQAGGGAGSVGLDSGRLASGAYIAELSIEAAGSAPRRRLLKLAVIQ